MASWSKRVFTPAQVSDWVDVHRKFEQHYMQLFPQHWSPDKRAEMMLVSTRADNGNDVFYMALPEGLPMYEGFSPIGFADLPATPNLLVADQIGYEQLFKNA